MSGSKYKILSIDNIKKMDIFEAIDILTNKTGFASVEFRDYRDQVFSFDNVRQSLTDGKYFLKVTNGIYGTVDEDNSYSRHNLKDANKDMTFPVRLAFEYDYRYDISNLIVKKIKNIKVIEYGNYLQELVSFAMQEKLNEAFESNKLKLSSNKYVDPLTGNKMLEYIYRGRRYVRLLVNGNAKYNNKLFPLTCLWFSCSPITWLVDEESNTCVSEKVLFRLSFDQFKNEKFLNLFAKEIKQVINLDNYENEDIKDIKKVLISICDILVTMPVDFRNTIIKKIYDLCNHYIVNFDNKKLVSFIKNDDIKFVLDDSKNTDKASLLVELNNIFTFLKKCREYNEVINEFNNYDQLMDLEINTLLETVTTNKDIIEVIMYYVNLMGVDVKNKVVIEIKKIGHILEKEYKLLLNSDISDTFSLINISLNDPNVWLKSSLEKYLVDIKAFYSSNQEHLTVK